MHLHGRIILVTDATSFYADAAKAAAGARLALRRIGQPEDVAGFIALVASDDAGYLTGQYLSAGAGGWCCDRAHRPASPGHGKRRPLPPLFPHRQGRRWPFAGDGREYRTGAGPLFHPLAMGKP